MRDIVERLETQAFVADKTQSGMAPLFEECLKEITRLRERLAEADECNRRVSDENARLRKALRPYADKYHWDIKHYDEVMSYGSLKAHDFYAAAEALGETDE